MSRILSISGTVHPQVEIQVINADTGTVVFRWLDADGNPVDSGGSTAAIEPLEPDENDVYPEVDDETLIAAIENPVAEEVPVTILTPLTIISRLTPLEAAGIFTSTDPEVCVWRNMACAAQEIRTDDPRTALGFALLVSKGLLAEGREAELMARE